jgi:hypothetical protein
MHPTRSKAKIFALGLAGCSIPCVAFAVSVPTGNVTNSGTMSTFDSDSALAPVIGETAGASTGDWLVQVGAYADRSLAQTRLKIVAALVAGYDLDDAQFVEPYTDHDRRTLYRAQFVGLTESNARSLCNSLGAVGESCFISRTDALNAGQFSGKVAPSVSLPAQETAPQSSATDSTLTLASVRPVGDDELENARGGFSVGGISFNFGASVQTLVNGQLALQTSLQWTSTGAVVTQVQGLGTRIQTQVASTLANAGINIPTTTNPTQAALSTVSTTPISPAASNMLPAVTTTSGATSLTGGSITPLSGNTSPMTPTNPTSNNVVNIPTTVTNSPASTTTVPVSFAGISPTNSGEGPTSSPLAPSISLTGLQNSSSSNPAPSGTQPLTANTLVTTTAIVPSSAGSQGSSPTSSSVSSPTVMSGVQIQSPTGSTEVLANVSNGQIQNVILNTASNQNIVQNTSMVLTIYNFASWQQQLAQHAMSAQLANQVLAASGFIGGR